MTRKSQKTCIVTILLLLFSLAQANIGARLREPGEALSTAIATQAQIHPISARLITRGNRPILLNSVNATTNIAIISGAEIETPDQVGATVDLGPLGSIDIAPNTKLTVEYSDGRVRITLKRGCAILRTNQNVEGSVDTTQGTAARTDSSKRSFIDICFPIGALLPLINQGAASNAGAGANLSATGPWPNSDEIPNMGHAPAQPDGVGRADVRVFDQSGRPVKGARVKLQSRRGGGRLCEAWAPTDDRGVAVVPPLHVGDLKMTISAKGYLTQTINVPANDLAQPVHVTLVSK